MNATLLRPSKSTYTFSSQPRVVQDSQKRLNFRQGPEKPRYEKKKKISIENRFFFMFHENILVMNNIFMEI